MSLPLPSSPHPPLLPRCSLHSDPPHLLHHEPAGSCPPLSSSAQPPRMGALHPVPGALLPVWLSLSPTLASGLVRSVEQSPTSTPWVQRTHPFARRTPHAVPGRWCGTPPGSSWEHSATPPALPRSLRQGGGLFSLRRLIPAGPRCPGLSNPWMPVWSSHFCSPVPGRPAHPLRPGAHSEETGGALQGLHPGSLAGGDGGLLIYFSFVGGFPPLSQFSFPPCGISLPSSHPRPVPTTGGAGSKGGGWDSVFHGCFY